MSDYLIVGGDSSLGKALARKIIQEAHSHLWTTSRHKHNIADNTFFFDLKEKNAALPRYEFDFVFFCAGITSVERCESNPQLALTCNYTHTLELIKKLASHGCKIIFPSTSYVFDGTKPLCTETDKTSPETYYAILKARTEEAIKELVQQYAIIRITKILTEENSFLLKWKDALLKGESVAAFYDMYLSPVSMDIACDYILKIARQPVSGTWHISGQKDISYYDTACMIAQSSGVSQDLVQATSARSAKISFIPRYTALSMDSTNKLLGLNSLPDEIDCIKQLISLDKT